MTFKLKSGNKISFKDMGSSPAKQKVDPDAPGTPGKPGYEPPVRREDLDEAGKKKWDELRKLGVDKVIPGKKAAKTKKSQEDWQPAYPGADYSKEEIKKMSEAEKQQNIDGYEPKKKESPAKTHDGTKSSTTHYADGSAKSKREIAFSKRHETEVKKGASVVDFDETMNKLEATKGSKARWKAEDDAYQKRKKELLNQGFTQEDADQMIKHGATTGEYGATTDKIASAKPRKKK